jgi:hypothetical protein
MQKWGMGLLIAILAIMPAAAEMPVLDFDSGAADVSAIVADAQESSDTQDAEITSVQAKYRSDRDCASFLFAPGDEGVSDRVWLRSTEWVEECHYEGDPRRGGGGRVCREVPRWTHREVVQVRLEGRQSQLPWENESFTVCLDGRWLSIHENYAAHKYSSRELSGQFTLTAGAKKAMRPDPAGIRLDAPVNSGANLSATFTDKWSEYYGGETTEFQVKLRRQVDGWFDSTLVEKTVSLPAAASYTVNFADYAADFTSKLKAGKKYYVEWSFKRLGSVSTDRKMKVGDSNTVVYQPTLQIVSR